VLARKKDGTLRFCVDYRQLNDVTKKDTYPLPRIDDCLDALGQGGYYSTLDLRSGYHQIAMAPEDSDKTAFVSRRGVHKWTVMPFGLCNAPATFQRLMDMVLAGLNYEILLCYLDDVIVYSRTVSEHIERLERVFERLQSANLTLKPSKCTLLQKSVSFLGHVIGGEGISMDPRKVKEVVEWPVPKTLTQVRQFNGLCSYYRRFVLNFAARAAPLYDLTKKERAFVWSDKCQAAFDDLKRALTSGPILAFPSDEGQFFLDTDASNIGIGGVLSQVIDGEERVIVYGSRKLSDAEKNYCVTRRELLAVVYFTKIFKQYLLGRHFTLRTDHAALRWLQKTPEPIGQQSRWLEKLAEFDFNIVHRPGLKHGNADALSRRPCGYCGMVDGDVMVVSAITSVTSEPVNEQQSREQATSLERLVAAVNEPGEGDRANEQLVEFAEPLGDIQARDPNVGLVRSWFLENATAPELASISAESPEVKAYWHIKEQLHLRDGVLYRKRPAVEVKVAGIRKRLETEEQLLVPKEMRLQFMRDAHAGMTGGHMGIRRTREQVRRRGYWLGWANDVRRFCQRCAQCNRYHRGNPPRQGPLQPLPCGATGERLHIDVTGPHPRSKRGNIYILTVTDAFSKFTEALPMPNQEAVTIARILTEQILARYGVPIQIVSDQGKNFDGVVFKEVCRLLGVDKQRTSPYHPSANGQAERQHRTINSMLGKIVSENQTDWDALLPFVMAAYRASRHETTGYTPNFLMFGRENRGPMDLIYGRPANEPNGENYSDHTLALAERMENAYRHVRENLKTAANRMKNTYDMRVKPAKFQIGDKVLYYTPRRYKGRSPKWTRCYTGPYNIVEQIGPVTYMIRKSAHARPLIVHTDKLKRFYDEQTGDSDTTRNDALAQDALSIDALGPITTRPTRDRRVPQRFRD
jgi:transposase InsO family protein